MNPLSDLFKGVRPSDLRKDHYHIIGEYIARTQKLADSVEKIEACAEQLLKGAMKSTEDGVAGFRALQRQMEKDFKELQSLFGHAINTAGNSLVKAVADVHASGANYLLFAGETAKARYESLESRVGEIERAAERLEIAAAKAEERRQLAHEELKKLTALKVEIAQSERESLRRVSEAAAKAYQDLGLLHRVWYVFRRPVLARQESSAPNRTPSLRGSTNHLAGRPEGRGAGADSGTDSANIGGSRRR